MSGWRKWMVGALAALFACGMMLADASLAHADGTDPTTAPSTYAGNTAKVSTCSAYAGVANRIASCIRDTMGNAASIYFAANGFYSLVATAITAMVTLAVAVYGVLAAAGMVEKVGRDSIMLLLKIAFVFFFTVNTQLIYYNVIGLMDSAATAVVGFVPSDGDAVDANNAGASNTSFGQLTCLQNMIQAQTSAGGSGVVGPWMAMDCVLDSVIGIKMPTTGVSATGTVTETYNSHLSDTDQGMSRGMLNFFFSAMQSSIIGLLMAIVGFIFIYGLIMLMMKALLTYLGGYMGVALMIIVSPLFIPLALFKQTKESYFDKWVKVLISLALQPIIILTFITFSISAMDLAIFSGDYSIMYSIAGDASRQSGFSLNKYFTDNNIIARQGRTFAAVPGDPSNGVQPTIGYNNGGIASGIAQVKNCFTLGSNPSDADKKACANNHLLKVWTNSVDWNKMASVRSPAVTVASGDASDGAAGREIASEVLSSILFSGIVVFILNGLFQIVPNVVTDLLGDFGQTPDAFKVFGKLPGGSGARGGVGGVVGSLSKSISDMAGRR